MDSALVKPKTNWTLSAWFGKRALKSFASIFHFPQTGSPDFSEEKWKHPLPPAIQKTLEQTAGRIRKTEIRQTLWLILGSVFLFFLVVVPAEHWLFPEGIPQLVRVLLLGGLLGGVGTVCWFKILPFWRWNLHPYYLAQVIETARPELQNSLLNLLFLLRKEMPENADETNEAKGAKGAEEAKGTEKEKRAQQDAGKENAGKDTVRGKMPGGKITGGKTANGEIADGRTTDRQTAESSISKGKSSVKKEIHGPKISESETVGKSTTENAEGTLSLQSRLELQILRILEVQTSREMAHVEPEKTAPTQREKRFRTAAFGLLALLLLYAFLTPKSTLRSVARTIFPWLRISVPTYVQIEAVSPGNSTIYQGEKLLVRAKIRNLRKGETPVLFYSSKDKKFLNAPISMQCVSEKEFQKPGTVNLKGQDEAKINPSRNSDKSSSILNADSSPSDSPGSVPENSSSVPGNSSNVPGSSSKSSGESIRGASKNGQEKDGGTPEFPEPETLEFWQAEIDGAGRGIQEDLIWHIQAGDAESPVFTLNVKPPLSVQIEEFTLTPPKYTQLPVVRQKGGDILAISGTELLLRVRTSEPAETVQLRLQSLSSERTKKFTLSPVTRNGIPSQTEFHGKIELKCPFWNDEYVQKEQIQAEFVFRNLEKIENSNPLVYRWEINSDLGPEIRILEGPEENEELDADGETRILLEASDPDFGLRAAAVSASWNGQRLHIPPILNLPSGEPGLKTPFQGEFTLRPASLGLEAGDEILWWIDAKDTRQPNGNRSQTLARRLRITQKSEDADEESNDFGEETEEENGEIPEETNAGDSGAADASDPILGLESSDPGLIHSENESGRGTETQPQETPEQTENAQNQQKEQQTGEDGLSEFGSEGESENAEKKTGEGGKEESDGKGETEEESDSAGESTPEGDSESEDGSQSAQNQLGMSPSQENEGESEPQGERKTQPKVAEEGFDPLSEEEAPHQKGEKDSQKQKSESKAQNSGGGEEKEGTEEQDGSEKNESAGGSQSSGQEKGSRNEERKSEKGEKSGKEQGTQNGSQKESSSNSNENGSRNKDEKRNPNENENGNGERNGEEEKEQSGLSSEEKVRDGSNSGRKPEENAQKLQAKLEEEQNENGEESGESPRQGPENADQPAEGRESELNETQQNQNSQSGTGQGQDSSQKFPDAETERENSDGSGLQDSESSRPGSETIEENGEEESGGQPKEAAEQEENGTQPDPVSNPGEAFEEILKHKEKMQPANSDQSPPNEKSPQGDGSQAPPPEKGPESTIQENQVELQQNGENGGQKPQSSEPKKETEAGQSSNQDGNQKGDSGDRKSRQDMNADNSVESSGSEQDAKRKSKGGIDKQSNQQGVGRDGSNSPNESGNPAGSGGKGPAGSRGGNSLLSDGTEGKSDPMNRPGNGEERKVGERQSQEFGSKKETRQTQNSSGGGSGMGSNSQGQTNLPGGSEAQESDEANAEFAQKQTVLALEHLRDALSRDDSTLLEYLGWTREEAQKFLEEWEKLNQDLSSQAISPEKQKETEEIFRNLGLSPRSFRYENQTETEKKRPTARSGRKTQAPDAWREQFEAYSRGVGSGE